MAKAETSGEEFEEAASSNLSSAPDGSPVWLRLDSVPVPEPVVSARDLRDSHPFDAHAHWQVWVLAGGILAVFVLAVTGWWQAACAVLVVLLLLVVGWRLTNRRSWIRARGRTFDATMLLLLAGAIAGLVVYLSWGGR